MPAAVPHLASWLLPHCDMTKLPCPCVARWTVLASLAVTTTVVAQVQIQLAPTDADPTAAGVYVDDSTQALDQFTLADRLSDLGEWRKAAGVYQEASSRFGNRLIAGDVNGSTQQYRPVREAVRARLAAWPAEGLLAYRERFEPEAQQSLEAARRIDLDASRRTALATLIDQYPLTVASAAATIELIDLHLARGDVATARRTASVAAASSQAFAGLNVDGITSDAAAAFTFRLALSAALVGDAEAAEAAVATLAETYSLATGTVAGNTVNLADTARQVLDNGIARRDATADPTVAATLWPTFDGASDRNRLAASAPGALSPQFAVDALQPTSPEQSQGDAIARRNGSRLTGQMAGVFPVAQEGVIYWSDNASLHAVDLISGEPPTAWSASNPVNDGHLSVEPNATLTPRGVALAPTLIDGRLIATMGRRDLRLEEASRNRQPLEPSVVAVDAATGVPLWTLRVSGLNAQAIAAALGTDDEGDVVNALAECVISSPPVVADAKVWVLAATDSRRGRPFEQSFALAIDTATGELLHVRPLATTGGGQMQMRGNAFIDPPPDVIPAASGGVVYLPTGRGVLAAMDATSGDLLWLNIYGVDQPENNGLANNGRFGNNNVTTSRRRFTSSLPFHAAAPVIDNGRIFFRPPDAEAVLIFDATDGSEIARLPAAPENVIELDRRQSPAPQYGPDVVRTVLAVDGDRLYALGGRKVYCLKWRDNIEAVRAGTFDELAPEAWAHWISTFELIPALRGAAVETIVGRPAVTQTHVVVPTADRLVLIDNETGLRDESRLGNQAAYVSLPPSQTAIDGERGLAGNVLVLDDRVVVAGQTTIGVWFDRATVRRRLLVRIEQTPDDPQPVIELARIDYGSGDVDGALAGLRQAAQMSGGRELAFDAAVALATSRAGAGVGVLLDYAEELAQTPRQQVVARLARLDSRDVPGGADEQLAALRDVLDVAEWRGVDLGGENAGFTARDVIAGRIEGLVAQSRSGLHLPIDDRAAAQLEQAGNDVAALKEVVSAFPNSPAGVNAALRLASLCDAPVARAESLRQGYAIARRLRDDSRLNDVLALMAQSDRASDRLDDAAARLRVIASRDANRLLSDGKTAEQAAYATGREAVEADAALSPMLDLPQGLADAPFADAVIDIADVDRLVAVPRGTGRDDRLVFTRGTTVGVADLQGEQWATDAKQRAEAAAWIDDRLLAWGESGIVSFDDTGGLVWRKSVNELQIGGVTAATVAADAVVLFDGQTLVAVASDGSTRWSTSTPLIGSGSLQGAADFVTLWSGTELAFHDAATGRLLARRSFDASAELGEVVDVLPIDGGRVAVVTEAAVLFLDPLDPTQRLGGVVAVTRVDRSKGATTFAVAGPTPASDEAFRWTGDRPQRRVREVAGQLVVSSDLRNAGRRDGIIIDPLDGTLLDVPTPVDDERLPVLLTGDTTDPAALGELAPRLLQRANPTLRSDETDGPGGDIFADGTRIYVTGLRGITAFDLDAPGDNVGPHWWRDDDAFSRAVDPSLITGVLLGRDYVLVLDEPTSGGMRIIPFGRQLVPDKGYESGLVRPALELDEVPRQVQPMQGGIAVLNEEGTLRLYRGAGQ